MPFSHEEHKQWSLEQYLTIRPEVTVDIGPGQGTYADLMRPHFQGEWKCVEAWAPYIPQYRLWDKYNHVVVSDIRHCDLFSVHPGPDLAIIGDCIEHMEEDEARYVLRRLQAWADNLLVSIPLGNFPQEDIGGNWFECHKSTWTHEMMLDALQPGGGEIDSREGDILGAYLWRSMR